MRHPRNLLQRLVRPVLGWFVLYLAASVASPLVHPQVMELVCSASGGASLMVRDEDGHYRPVGQHVLDCPLCVLPAGGAPGPQIRACCIHAPQHDDAGPSGNVAIPVSRQASFDWLARAPPYLA